MSSLVKDQDDGAAAIWNDVVTKADRNIVVPDHALVITASAQN